MGAGYNIGVSKKMYFLDKLYLSLSLRSLGGCWVERMGYDGLGKSGSWGCICAIDLQLLKRFLLGLVVQSLSDAYVPF